MTSDASMPSLKVMKERAEMHDVVVVLTVDPRGYWTLQDIDRQLLTSEDEGDQKAAVLEWLWSFQRAMSWVGISGRKVE